MQFSIRKISIWGLAIFLLVFSLIALDRLSRDGVLLSKQQFDRNYMGELLSGIEFSNDVILDSFLIEADIEQQDLIRKELLGLRRDRLAYLVRDEAEVIGIIVPATSEDGFNDYIDLLVAVDMYGRIIATRVIEDVQDEELFGALRVIESQWIKLFSGNAMRDVQRISWQTISEEGEYDQFVGASITPKAVSKRIYDVLVFVQSNRISLINGLDS